MANTPEVDEWLAKTNNLLTAAVSLSAAPVDADTAAMMRQVRTAAVSLMTALQQLQLPPGM